MSFLNNSEVIYVFLYEGQKDYHDSVQTRVGKLE